jgi:carbon-monoxide dehydrogenase medium subunit
MLNLRLVRPGLIVDINRVDELRGLSVEAGGIEAGATVRMSDLERDGTLGAVCPVLAELLPMVGHPAIRSRGTLCGSVAHADPAAEIPAAAVALDATVTLVRTGSQRSLPVAQFLRGPLMTAIDPGELVRSISFPAWVPGTGWGVAEFARRHGDFAIGGAIVVLATEGRHVTRAGVTVFGVAGAATRLHALENELIGSPATRSLAARAAETALTLVRAWPDGSGSDWYRSRLAAALVGRAFEQAVARAGA